MGARDSVMTGAAGEAYVLYRLGLLGLLAAQAPPNAYLADILVFSPRMQVGSMVQVKTRTSGADGGWHMRAKHEGIVHPRLFYVFLDLQPSQPVAFVLPSTVVADVLRSSHQAWLALPGQDGRPHRDNPLRRILPSYQFDVPGLVAGWLEPYREAWAVLTTDDDA